VDGVKGILGKIDQLAVNILGDILRRERRMLMGTATA
jgi:hypothetical protein